MKHGELFSVQDARGPTPFIELSGRFAWALTELIRAGEGGCTTIDHPGPRWAAYVFKLRRMGIHIETVTEAHGGPFKGTHARYILRTTVHRLTPPGSASTGQSAADAA